MTDSLYLHYCAEVINEMEMPLLFLDVLLVFWMLLACYLSFDEVWLEK
jgi:hypothetical protein